LARALGQSRYIGPLREVPRRSHQAPLTPDPTRWSSGLAGWDTLATSDKELIDKVSEWLSSESRLGTGYNLIRRRFVELSTERDNYIMRILQQENPLDDLPIALEGIRNLPEKTRLLFQDAESPSALEVEPQDIAVGLTQLVP